MNLKAAREPARLEGYRRRATLILAHVGWWGALAGTTAIALDVWPRAYGVVIVLFIGIGISCGLALSRMRLTEVITGVFEAGITVSTEHVDTQVRRLRHERDQQFQQLREEIAENEAARKCSAEETTL